MMRRAMKGFEVLNFTGWRSSFKSQKIIMTASTILNMMLFILLWNRICLLIKRGRTFFICGINKILLYYLNLKLGKRMLLNVLGELF